MEYFCNLILVAFFATNPMDKAESVQLEETPLKIIDEIFGEGWWDNDKAKEWHKLTLEQNVHHQIDRQNTQLGQIESNSIDQLGQIESNSTDQNSPLTESDHSDNTKNGDEQNETIKEITSNEKIAENERKRKIVDKFHVMRNEFKQKGKYSKKEWVQIEDKIANHLKVSRSKIYKWKKALSISEKMHNFEKKKIEHKYLVEKFDQRKAELTRDGFKNSYPNQINKTVAKELGLSFMTIYNWKSEFGQTTPKHIYSHNEQLQLMKGYYEIKNKNPKMSVMDIAKMLKIGKATLYKWKSQFKCQQLHPTSVDGHSVDVNASGSNVHEIENSIRRAFE